MRRKVCAPSDFRVAARAIATVTAIAVFDEEPRF